MKKLRQNSIIAVMLFSTILFVNCENENLETKEMTLTPELIGKIHNDALDNIFSKEDSFNFNTNEKGFKNQLINENNNFLSKKLNLYNINSFKKNDLNRDLQLLSTDEFISKNFKENTLLKKSSFSMQESNVFEKIEFIKSSGLILNEDEETLNILFTAYKSHYEGAIDDIELINIAKNIKNDYINKNSDHSNTNVFLTLSILEICTNSLDWFNENKYNLENQNTKYANRVPIAPIVAADAVGAIVGIGEGIIASGIINGTNQPADGTSIAVGALVSAATSSIGAGVKAVGWLVKLFT